MRILVYPHELGMGGSQINALELASAVRNLGHEVFVFAATGILIEKVKELSLQFIEAPPRTHGVDPATIRKLTSTVRSLDIDLVHPYEWAPCVETAFGPALRYGTTSVMTVLSMDVPDFLPRHFPLIVGTQGLAEEERRRRTNIHVIEPPIDTAYNKPGATAMTRQQLDIPDDEFVITVVGRLSTDLGKLEGVRTAVSVVDRLAARFPVTLLVAGDGPGLREVRAAEQDINRQHGRKVIRVAGNVVDPRPLYDAADVVLGMGSSALRGMSYGKPLIVQGTAGFWRLSCPENEEQFLMDGWFGHGSGGNGAVPLEEVLVRLINSAGLRTSLGAYNRRLVEHRFSLEHAAQRLESIYLRAVKAPQQTVLRSRSLIRTGYEVAKFRTVINLEASGLRLAKGARQ
jgi:glycosyltransferase involved in cell wall biosynthesis